MSKRESHWFVVTNFRLRYRLCTKLFRMVCDRFSRKKFERNGRWQRVIYRTKIRQLRRSYTIRKILRGSCNISKKTHYRWSDIWSSRIEYQRTKVCRKWRCPHSSCVHSVVISKQLWECRCAQLLYSLPRERPRSKWWRSGFLFASCCWKSATLRSKDDVISVQFLFLSKTVAIQPTGMVEMDKKHWLTSSPRSTW